MSRQKKEKLCEYCGNPVPVSHRKYCSAACRIEGKKKVLSAKKAGEFQKKKKPKKKYLSINEVLALGRKHNIYGYGNILAAIEKGEIK